VVAVFAVTGGYGLLMPKPTTAVVAVMKDKPPAAKTATIVETIKKDNKVAASAVASRATVRGSESTPAAATAMIDSIKDTADNSPGGTGVTSAHVTSAQRWRHRRHSNRASVAIHASPLERRRPAAPMLDTRAPSRDIGGVIAENGGFRTGATYGETP
jgi:hypothetical protein